MLPAGPSLNITGGAQRGSNLFHSFEAFSVGQGQAAFFLVDNAAIQTVLARVTGNQRSDILGRLGVRASGGLAGGDPPINLFLINPNGVFFGPNASLDLRGSFGVTTATAVQFGDQGSFSAVPPTAVPLLTVQPTALLFGRGAPAGIEVQAGEIDLFGSPSGLVVEDGQNLLVVAGNVTLDSGILIAQNGRIDIAALGEAGAVPLTGVGNVQGNNALVPGSLGALARADLAILNQSGVNVSANLGGEISVQADDVTIDGGSILIAGIDQADPRDPFGLLGLGGDRQAGDITIDATGLVRIAQGSSINNGAIFGGNGGGITLSGRAVELLTGGYIGSASSSGTSKDVVINATESITLSGFSQPGQFVDFFSGLSALLPLLGALPPEFLGARASGIVNYVTPSPLLIALNRPPAVEAGGIQLRAPVISLQDGGIGTPNLGAGGDTGDIEIWVDRLDVMRGARLISTSNGAGDAGDISIRPFDSGAFGSQPGGQPGGDRRLFFSGPSVGIFSSVEPRGVGRAGNIALETDGLILLEDGARLQSTSLGRGDAGNISIVAGDRLRLDQGIILSDIANTGIGNGGAVRIEAGNLELQNNAVIRTATFGQGDAGEIEIGVGDRSSFDGASLLSSRVDGRGIGHGGRISLRTGDLAVLNGSQFVTNTSGLGDAGPIAIAATGSVMIQGTEASGIASIVSSQVNPGGRGDGGDISIQAAQLSLLDGAQVVAATEGFGDAGSVRFNIGADLRLDGRNPITRRSSGIFTNNGTPGSGSGIGTGLGGDIDLSAQSLTLSNGAVLNARTANGQAGGDIGLSLSDLQILSGAQIISTSDGDGPAGTVQLNATNGLVIAGTDPDYLVRQAQFGLAIAPLTASSGIYLRSTGNGAAGNVTIGSGTILGTPRLSLSDGAELIADSNAVNGGNITLNLTEVVLMSNGSFIGASAGRAQGAGNGGNILINSPSVLSLPGENNDIIANAFSGSGGQITVAAEAINGFELQPNQPDVALLRANRTNDITVNATSGTTGTLDLQNFNVDPSQGAAELPLDLSDPSNQISRQCSADTIARSKFVVTGRGGLPESIGETAASVGAWDAAWIELPAQLSQARSEQAQSPQVQSAQAPVSPGSVSPGPASPVK
ncbi:MAG: filamentous hemagglutinin N-terminal domain-containing protein, partial [Synechococcales cyanobacterium RM1_1_8]|nr:filamentous hemagglutinin N-terminal domain-containing protein [Synechococcales cyanobacterium RM1_1_8]